MNRSTISRNPPPAHTKREAMSARPFRPSPASARSRPRRLTSAAALAFAGPLLVLASFGAGCAHEVRPELGFDYPQSLGQARTLDVQVVRDPETHIAFTNTTASPIGPGRVWLNQAYSQPLDRVAVGQTRTLDLREFRNQFGESFRAGGFFATRTPKDVVLVQVHERGRDELLGFVVVRGQAEP